MKPAVRLSDLSFIAGDGHGCMACTHMCTGPIINASNNCINRHIGILANHRTQIRFFCIRNIICKNIVSRLDWITEKFTRDHFLTWESKSEAKENATSNNARSNKEKENNQNNFARTFLLLGTICCLFCSICSLLKLSILLTCSWH